MERQVKKVVDTREPEVIKTRLIELGWEQQALYSADYWWLTYDYKKVGTTRKRVDDLMGSIGKKLSGQLEEMLDFYDINIWMIEGSWKNVLNGVVIVKGVRYQTWDMVWNYIHRWMAKGFILDLTTSEGHSIHRLNALYALYQKPYSLSANTRKFTDDRILAFPSGCRGKTGQGVLDACGSLERVIGLSSSELETIPTIGKKKAQLIYDHFHRGGNSEQDSS